MDEPKGGSMTQILVLYYSRSGNTKKLAEAVTQGARSVDSVRVVIKSVSEVTKDDFLHSDGIIAGSPVYFGSMAAELKEIFDKFIGIRKNMENKVGAAFATSHDPTGGKETTILSILQAMLIYGMIVVGDPFSATGHYGTACSGPPDAIAMKNGAELGKRVAQLVKRLGSDRSF
jgi:NAD(P)H dehydrogenase (quinone)